MRTSAIKTPRGAIALCAVAMTAGAFITGCAPGGKKASTSTTTTSAAAVTTGAAATDKKVTITISDGWGKTGSGATFDNVITAFEKKYPNITVKRDTTDYASYQQSINNLGSSPNPPDLLMLETSGYGQGFYQLVRAGLLRPLDSYAKAYGWASRFGAPSSLNVFRFDTANHNQWGTGSLYGVPEQNSMITVFSNQKLMDKAGVRSVPTTFAAFEKSLAAAKAKGITPIAESSTYIHTEMALWDSFVPTSTPVNDWIYGRTGGSFASAANVKAAQTISDWQSHGYFEKGASGTSDSDAANLFLTGKTMYYIEGSWMAGGVQASLKSGGGAFRLPGATAGAPSPVGGGFSTPLAISSKSKHADVAAAFINYFVSVANSDYLFNNGWGLPGASVSPAVAKGTSLTNKVLSILTPIQAAGGAGTTPFLDWATPTMTSNLPTYLQNLASGKTSPSAFTSKVQGQWSTFQQQRRG